MTILKHLKYMLIVHCRQCGWSYIIWESNINISVVGKWHSNVTYSDLSKDSNFKDPETELKTVFKEKNK